jgi:hypothetical protein
MFLRYAVLAFLLLISSVAYSGEASISKSFYVDAHLEQLATWLDNHRDQVAESTHCKIISRQGDLIRVRRDTIKGTYDFTLRERIVEGEGKGTYSTVLVQSHIGKLTEEKIIVNMSAAGNRTLIHLYAYAKVDDKRIKDMDVRVGLSVSARGFQRLLTKTF